MVSKLDESVGRVVQALQRRHMLQNSIIVFLSDNGAPTKGKQPNWGSNWPFKGVSISVSFSSPPLSERR
jgi:arylsulfatase A-like enzyme